MPGPYKEAARRLHEIAQSQQGFFTTKQATRSGFAEKTHSYHVNAGNWIREHRGIYRLADFPAPERPDLMLWYLWSQNRQEVPEGTYSHDTALSLHELSDLMPSKLHMTVPREFRRNSTIPEILVLHRAHLDPERSSGNARGPRDASAQNHRGSTAQRTRGPEPTEASRRRSHTPWPHRKERNRSHAGR